MNLFSHALSIGIAVAILVGCGGTQSAVPQLPATSVQAQPVSSHSGHLTLHYKLIVLPTLGGPQAFGDAGHGAAKNFSNDGTASGVADTSSKNPYFPNFNPLMSFAADPFVFHAFAWKSDHEIADLGALPGPNSSAASWVARDNLICGQSLNGTIDPFTGWPAEHAVLWSGRHVVDLGTLGGYESGSSACNNHGQVVGFAANSIPDKHSLLFFGTQTRAFVWHDGIMRDIGTLGGPDAVTTNINERSEIVGAAYTSPSATKLDPFFWDRGKMTDIGSLGGTSGFPGALNNRGEVVGGSNLAGDTTSHPFLWSHGHLRDLGTLGGTYGSASSINEAGDVAGGSTIAGDQALHAFFWRGGHLRDIGTVPGLDSSNAFTINAKDQVVGQAFNIGGSGVPHGFLWQEGQIIDLNAFVPPHAHITLEDSEVINDRGEIFGLGVLPNGNSRAFVLVPCGKNDPDGIAAVTTNAGIRSVISGGGDSENARLLKLRIMYPYLKWRYRGSGTRAAADA